MIAGRFNHWMPVAIEGGSGADSAAQIFFDVTGLARSDDSADELFSFTARTVERIGELAFVAKGTLQQGDVERPVDAVVQTPMSHTPFVAITFPLDQGAFPEVWGDLSALVATRTDSSQLGPRAWVKAPMLATA